MPDSSLFQQLLSRANTPLVPQIGEAADSAANSITEPSLNQSPAMASLKGFGAGALQGAGHLVSGMTSPMSLGITAATGGLGKLLGAGAGALEGSAAPSAVDAAGVGMNAMRGMLEPVTEKLGERLPQFTPVGGEDLYNAGRQGPHTLIDPAYKAYLRIMANKGR